MTDARERRRQRAQQEKRADIAGGLKKFRVPLIIAVIWALVVAYNVAAAQGVIDTGGEECPGHWHAGFSVWVDGQKIPFPASGQAADQTVSPGAGFHVHGDDGILHFHPGRERCIPLEDALAKLGVEVSGSQLTVRGQTFEENGTHEVVVFHQRWGGDWSEVGNVGRLVDRQVGNGDRVMISYGDHANGTLAQQQNQTRDMAGGNYEPPEPGSGFTDQHFIGITMATIFAALAIVMWYNFAKKTW